MAVVFRAAASTAVVEDMVVEDIGNHVYARVELIEKVKNREEYHAAQNFELWPT
jgi:hypothetical protein